jgi:hypothetical protein
LNAIWASVIVRVVLGALEGAGGWLRQKHDSAKQRTIDSQKKALESVGESTKKEAEIKEGQDNVKPADVGKDGGVSTGDYNAGK